MSSGSARTMTAQNHDGAVTRSRHLALEAVGAAKPPILLHKGNHRQCCSPRLDLQFCADLRQQSLKCAVFSNSVSWPAPYHSLEILAPPRLGLIRQSPRVRTMTSSAVCAGGLTRRGGDGRSWTLRSTLGFRHLLPMRFLTETGKELGRRVGTPCAHNAEGAGGCDQDRTVVRFLRGHRLRVMKGDLSAGN
jgi:hypothetical protein